MLNEFKTYTFTEANQKTLVFVPGYTSGLEAPIISELIRHYVSIGDYNVLGLLLSYTDDTPDLYDHAQSRIRSSLQELKHHFPNQQITLISKSLGGALSLALANDLPIKQIVVLGFSVILGWPQRISVLSQKDVLLPDFKTEWSEKLHHIKVRTLLISADSDELTDNVFLQEQVTNNANLSLCILEHANHSLEDQDSMLPLTQECARALDSFLLES